MTNSPNNDFLQQVRTRIQKKKQRTAMLLSISLTMFMVFTVIQSTSLIRHDLQISYINDFWYSHIEESVINYELEDEYELSDENALEYLIDSMEIEEFIQFVDKVKELDWLQNLQMKG